MFTLPLNHMFKKKKTIFYAMIALLGFSFGLRYLLYLLEPQIQRDSLFYMQYAEIWAGGGDVDTLYSVLPKTIPFLPLYLYLMKILILIGFSAETAGVWISLCSGTMIPIVIFIALLGLSCKNYIAFLGAVCAVVHPGLLDLSTVILRDSLYLFLFTCCITCLIWGIKRKRLFFWFLAGGLCALGIMTRYEMIEVAFLLFLILFILAFAEKLSWHETFSFAIFFILGFLFIVGILYRPLELQSTIFKTYNLRFEQYLELRG